MSPEIMKHLSTPVQPLKSRLLWLVTCGPILLLIRRVVRKAVTSKYLVFKLLDSELGIDIKLAQLIKLGRISDESGRSTLRVLSKRFPRRWYADKIKLMGFSHWFTKQGEICRFLKLNILLSIFSAVVALATIYLWLGIVTALIVNIGFTAETLLTVIVATLIYGFCIIQLIVLHVWPGLYARQLRADLSRILGQ